MPNAVQRSRLSIALHHWVQTGQVLADFADKVVPPEHKPHVALIRAAVQQARRAIEQLQG